MGTSLVVLVLVIVWSLAFWLARWDRRRREERLIQRMADFYRERGNGPVDG